MSNIHKNISEITKSIYSISLSPYTDWKSKIYCNTYLSYLINPDDVIPDHLRDGFLDDTYLGLLILNDLVTYRKDLLKQTIDNFESLEISVNSVLPQIENELKDKADIIKQFSGYSSLINFDLANSKITPKLSVNLMQKTKLIGSIAFCYNILLRRNGNSSDLMSIFTSHAFDYLHAITEIGDFFEIKRVLDCYENKIENDMREDSEYDYRFFNYLTYIEKSIHIHTHKEITIFLPVLFKILINIFKDELCTWEIKHEINSALAYLIISEDVIDDRSDDGLIDDIFFLTFVISDIYNINEDLVNKNLINISLNDIITILDACQNILEYKTGFILNHLGFLSLMEFYQLHNEECPIYRDNESYSIYLHNNRLKSILIELIRFIFPNKLEKKNKGGPGIEFLLKKLEEIANEENTDICSKKELDNFIELSFKISYVKNLEDEFNKKEQEEIQLIRLKHRIMESY
jgi:uncharacterized membrane protein YkvA (DUF1232 family)